MTRDKHYTVNCSNKFAVLDSEDDESSENEHVESKREEKEIGEKKINTLKSTQLETSKETSRPNTVKDSTHQESRIKYEEKKTDSDKLNFNKEESNMHSREENERSVDFSRRGRGRGYNNYNSYGNSSRGRNNIGSRGYRNFIHDDERRNEDGEIQQDRSSNYRGNRGHRNFRGRQEFDRQNRRNYNNDIKKDGHGMHNWGNAITRENYESEESNEKKNIGENEKTDLDNNNNVLSNGDIENENKKDEIDKKPQIFSFEEYKKLMESKRVNISKHSTEEKQKDFADEAKETGNADDHNKKKKNRNVLEYYSKDGGNGLSLFSKSRRGRGRGNDFTFKTHSLRGSRFRFPKGRDAPDLEDERSFPKLC